MLTPKPKLTIVGPPYQQTLLAAWILFIGFVFCVCLFAYNLTFHEYKTDNKYSATVYYSDYGYRFDFWGQNNDLEKLPKGVARGYYEPSYKLGLDKFEIELSSNHSDRIKTKACGLLEGYLSWRNIYAFWKNTIEPFCMDNENDCVFIRRILNENKIWILNQVEVSGNTLDFQYWEQIYLFYIHIEGIEKGYRYGMKRNGALGLKNIPSLDFIWLNVMSELGNFNSSYLKNPFMSNFLASSVLFVNSSRPYKLNVVQTTLEKEMSNTLRIMKSYNTANLSIQFTGYPGCISGYDNFYVLKRNTSTLIVVGNKDDLNMDISIFKYLNEVFQSSRVLMANRLSFTSTQWKENFDRFSLRNTSKNWKIFDAKALVNRENDWILIYKNWAIDNKQIFFSNASDIQSLLLVLQNGSTVEENITVDRNLINFGSKIYTIDLITGKDSYTVIDGPLLFNQKSTTNKIRFADSFQWPYILSPNTNDLSIYFRIFKIELNYNQFFEKQA